MDVEQYDLLMFLMTDYDLRKLRETLTAAQRVERHRPDGMPSAYDAELQALDLELERRVTEGDRPF